jgi:homoserine dehydrogenase
VSIKSMQQRGNGADAPLIFVTHRAREAHNLGPVHPLRDVAVVHRVGSVLRVLGDED